MENSKKNLNIFIDPISVPATTDPAKESFEDRKIKYQKFVNLAKNIRFKLASPETSQKIQAIGQKYGFELERLANITRLIREYYFGEVSLEDFPKEIESRMGVSLLTAQEIARYIQQEIIDWDPWAEYLATLPKRTVREIVERHPKIAEMEITKGYVELKDSGDLEDPTIKNWIRDYVSHLGYGAHSQMERAQYLFHSENGMNLDSSDREKLGIILRSFDENVPLPVDEENNEIIFSDQGIVNSEQSKPQAPHFQEKPVTQAPVKPIFPSQPQSAPAPQKQKPFIREYNPVSESKPTVSFSQPAPQNTQPEKEIFIRQYSPPSSNRAPFDPPQSHSTESKSNPDSDIRIHRIPDRPDFPFLGQSNFNKNERASNYATFSPEHQEERPRHQVIDPFDKEIPEPKIEGNIVDLRGE